MLSILRGLKRRLFQAGRFWLRGDAIRVTASERIWLEIEPPAEIYWRGETIQVLSRDDDKTADEPVIIYRCLTSRGDETLLVHPGRLHEPPRCEWTEAAPPL